MNVRLHRRAKASWERLNEIYPEIVTESTNIETQPNELLNKDHFWWPGVASYINQNEPEPMYMIHNI